MHLQVLFPAKVKTISFKRRGKNSLENVIFCIQSEIALLFK